MKHSPAGGSTLQLIHYGQLLEKGSGFRCFNYGPVANLRIYRSLIPPQYPLNEITAPIALHYGLKDNLADIVDVQLLAATLPNVVELREVPHPEFGHAEFILATEIRPLVYNHMLTTMQAAEGNQTKL